MTRLVPRGASLLVAFSLVTWVPRRPARECARQHPWTGTRPAAHHRATLLTQCPRRHKESGSQFGYVH